jgi:hypothetical protein
MTDVELHWFIVYFIHTMHKFFDGYQLIMYGVCRKVQGKNYIWESFLCRIFL